MWLAAGVVAGTGPGPYEDASQASIILHRSLGIKLTMYSMTDFVVFYIDHAWV